MPVISLNLYLQDKESREVRWRFLWATLILISVATSIIYMCGCINSILEERKYIVQVYIYI